MAYKTIKESFWTDPKIRQLSPDDKLVFLYCVTSPHSHYSGLFYLPITFMAEEIGMPQKILIQCINNLESRLLIRYDKVTSTIFVMKMFKHQNNTGGNPKVLKSGIEKQLQNIHSQTLLNAFIEEYQYLNLTLPERYTNVEPTLNQRSVTVTVTDTVTDKEKSMRETITPIITPERFQGWFDVLKTIHGYPFNEKLDFEFLSEKEKDFPKVDITSLLKAWKIYIGDAPFKKNARHRSQLHNQFEFAIKYNKHLRATLCPMDDYETNNAFDKIKKDRIEFERSQSE